MFDPDAPRIAAVVSRPGQATDAVVRDFVDGLRAKGIRVQGLLQEVCPNPGHCKYQLQDIITGKRYPISQDLGNDSGACALDPAGLAEASEVIRRVEDATTDLVVFNRFSGLEAEGQGFAQEMLDIMSRGLPVLTIVREFWLPAWRRFTGDLADEILPEHNALNAWFRQSHPER